MGSIVARIIRDNLKKESNIRLCAQALCKCIVNIESAEIAGSQGVHDALCEVESTSTRIIVRTDLCLCRLQRMVIIVTSPG